MVESNIYANGTSEIPLDRLRILAELKDLAEGAIEGDGRHSTSVDFLMINRYRAHIPPIPVVLTPSLCLILQGAKKVNLGEHLMQALPGDFLTTLIALPGMVQVCDATPDDPYVGLRIDLTAHEIATVVAEAGLKINPRDPNLSAGAFIGNADLELLELIARLLRLVHKPEAEAGYLSSLIKREFIFRLLTSEYGHLLMQQVFFDQQAEGIGKALTWIQHHFNRPFSVDELAKVSNMSVSGLHHKFKSITSMGPLQYQKQLRLQEARRLLLSGAMDATTVSLEVGYESPSQFKCEYRRLFGLPPLKDVKAVKQSAASELLG